MDLRGRWTGDAQITHETAISVPLAGLGGTDRREVNLAGLALSLLIHGSLILAAAIAVRETVSPAPVPSIAVEIISEAAYRALIRLPPVPARVPAADTEPIPPAATPDVEPEPVDAPIVATTLMTEDILADPANRLVRDTLPKLASTERIIQLCAIEAIEQIRLAKPGSRPDSIAAASFAASEFRDGVLAATGAAYRSDRQWYHLSFRCAPRGDLLAVTSFSLQLGDLVPEAEWEAHDLNGEDLVDD